MNVPVYPNHSSCNDDPAITTPPLAYTVEEFAASARIGRTRTYAAIKEGKLRARKYGKRTLILPEEGRAFLASLPELQAP